MGNIIRTGDYKRSIKALDEVATIIDEQWLTEALRDDEDRPVFSRAYTDRRGRKDLRLEVLATGYATITIEDHDGTGTPETWEASPALLDVLIDALVDMHFAAGATEEQA